MPRALVVDYLDEYEYPNVKYIDITKRPQKSGKWKPLPEYGAVLHSFRGRSSDKLFAEFYQQTKINSKNHTDKQREFYEKNKVIRYLRKADLQNFFKRLRYYISKVDYTQITFFGCGEYGPQTFRPHFHVLLHFDNPQLIAALEKNIVKAWKFGRVHDISAVCKPSGASAYVATYCNSLVTLPRYLRSDKLAPFSSHSLGYGKDNYKELRDYLYENPGKSASEFDIQLSDECYHYYPAASISRSIYPRCYNYGLQNDKSLYKLYTIYKELNNRYNTEGCVELTLRTLNDSDKFFNKQFLDCLDIGHASDSYYYTQTFYRYNIARHHKKEVASPPLRSCPLSLDMVAYNWDVFHCLPDETVESTELTLYQRAIFSRVYTAILLSKHFITWCCEKHTPLTVISFIKEFYSKLELDRLRQQYEAQQEYYDTTFSDNYEIFYPITHNNVDYDQIYNGNVYIKQINILKDLEYSNKVKHKYLNDKNIKYL